MRAVFGKTFVVLIVIILFIVVFSISYAMNQDKVLTNIGGSILAVDEEVYNDLTINSNDFVLVPILDNTVEDNIENVIKLNFKVGGSKENKTKNILYDISLTKLNLDCELYSPYLKWKLLKNGELISEGSLSNEFDTVVNGRLVLTLVQQDLKDYSEDKSTYDDFIFYMWLSDSCQDEDIINCLDEEGQNDLLEKKITGRISIELSIGTKKELVRKPNEAFNIEECNNESGVKNDENR